jgi:hypothetical protein
MGTKLRVIDFIKVIKDNLGFIPHQMNSSFDSKKNYKYNDLTFEMLSEKNPDTFTILDKSLTNTFTFVRNNRFNLTSLFWSPENYKTLDLTKILTLTSLNTFTVGYLYNGSDALWQSEETISNYESRQKTHSHLPKIKDETWGMIIGVSKNYGRHKMVNGVWLMAAPEMWFGSAILILFQKKNYYLFRRRKQLRGCKMEQFI